MSNVIPIRHYEVFFTILEDKNKYGTVVDVTKDVDMSDYIKEDGIGKIKRELDNGDYDIGVFTYGSIDLKCLNIDGRFNDENDWRSIFPYTRDKTKVLINFYNAQEITPSISFEGIIAEEGTRQDILKDQVTFKVLAKDSVIQKTKVSGGTVASGSLFSTAIKTILNVPDITSVLTFDPLKINVQLDLVIDDGSWFDNKSTRDALNALMVASNSVTTIENNTLVVRDRLENSGSVFRLYGHGDLFGRENILNITNFNTGLHRTFTSVDVNNINASNNTLIDTYGARKKTVSLPFITDDVKEFTIASNILDEFKVPKIELEVDVKTEVAKTVNLLDLVSISYPYRVKPSPGTTLPLYGVSKYGSAVYPIIQGNIKISPNAAFKVVGFKEDPKKFITKLMLRQRGRSISDGLFSTIGTYYGTAIYGESVYQFDADRIDPNTISVYGAGKYGTMLFRS